MAKFEVVLYVQGKQYFNDVEADSEEEAIEKCKYGEVPVSLNKISYTDEEAWEVK